MSADPLRKRPTNVLVVLDTNILVSSFKSGDGLEARVVGLVLTNLISACVSEHIFREYFSVLRRPRLHLDADEVNVFFRRLSDLAFFLDPQIRRTASPDESDNRLLECAEAAEADFLVTGNKRHFPTQWKSTAIVNAREFLTRLSE